jgi:alpha-beta hydrolase superfamily lysophospholipase
MVEKNVAEWTLWPNSSRKFTRQWSVEEPVGVVCVVHGLGEHSGRYASLAARLNQSRLNVVSFDQQGHGRDSRKRGCIESYSSLLDDISSFLDWARSQFPGLPIILFGHSMGGNLVINHALRRHPVISGMIVSSPMLRAQRKISPLLEFFVRTLKIVLPNHQIHSEIRVERLMSDRIEQDALRSDDLFHNSLSLRLAAELVDTGEWAISHAAELRQPILLVHAGDDYLTSPTASAEFAANAGDYCTFVLLNGMLHDTFRCLEKESVVGRFVAFIETRIAQCLAGDSQGSK